MSTMDRGIFVPGERVAVQEGLDHVCFNDEALGMGSLPDGFTGTGRITDVEINDAGEFYEVEIEGDWYRLGRRHWFEAKTLTAKEER